MTHGSPPETLRLLTYNIWLRPRPFLDGQLRRAAALPARLQGHDALVICEAWQRRLSCQIFAALGQAYPHQTRPAPAREPVVAPARAVGGGVRLWGGGVAILSRWPFERTERRSFRGILGHPDSHANKGVIYARLNKQGRRYHIFGAHTQASPEGYVRLAYRAFGRDAEARFLHLRQAQFERMRLFIEELSIPPDQPVLIAGDLNTDRLGSREAFGAMLERLDACCDERHEGPTGTYDPVNNPLAAGERAQWLDYVLWSRSHLQPASSRVRVIAPRSEEGWRRHALGRLHHDLSDHYALSAELQFD